MEQLHTSKVATEKIGFAIWVDEIFEMILQLRKNGKSKQFACKKEIRYEELAIKGRTFRAVYCVECGIEKLSYSLGIFQTIKEI